MPARAQTSEQRPPPTSAARSSTRPCACSRVRGSTPAGSSDIADEAGVAYGLVYHYFASKDEILDTLFLERWNVMLEPIRHVDEQELPAREKLAAIASFIIDCYAHDPELMKVIIVEVTRAANSFGQTHLPRSARPSTLIEGSWGAPRPTACSSPRSTPVRRDDFLWRDRAGADGLDLRPAAERREHYERAKWLVVETIVAAWTPGLRDASMASAASAGERPVRACRPGQ